MKTASPNQSPTRKPCLPSLIRWFVWGFLILLLAGWIIPLVGAIFAVAKEGSSSRTLPFLIFMVVFVVGFFGIKALTNPILGRGDERRTWEERFPSHTDQEIDRFLRVVADSLLSSDKHLARLRPDDTAAALTQQWLFGDGMDIIELLMSVEQEYGLELPECFHEGDRNLGDLFDYVTRASSGRPPPGATGSAAQADSG